MLCDESDFYFVKPGVCFMKLCVTTFKAIPQRAAEKTQSITKNARSNLMDINESL